MKRGEVLFVKIYQYHIQLNQIEEYLRIQDQAIKIYSQYVDFQTVYINSKEDATKWLEISTYKDENEYKKSIDLINEDKEIQELFKKFQSLLSPETEIIEEDFMERKRIGK